MLLLFCFEQESVDISPIQLRRQINMSALSEDDEHYLQLISELPKSSAAIGNDYEYPTMHYFRISE